MKRMIKMALAVIMTVSIAFGLCSCQALDYLKASHAVWGDGRQHTILYDNSTYRKLDNAEGLEWIDDIELHVTSPDVPALLSLDFGVDAYANAGKTVIAVGDYEVYCREQQYEAIQARLNAADYSRYGYWYIDMKGNRQFYLFSEQDSQLMDKILATKPLSETELKMSYVTECYACSADALFRKPMPTFTLMEDINVYGDTNGYYLYTEMGDGVYYPVSPKWNADIERIFSNLEVWATDSE